MAKAEFLNLDFDLESHADLSLLIEELGDAVVLMRNDRTGGVHSISIELAGVTGSPESLIQKYSEIFGDLSNDAMKLFHGGTVRNFDFGFEGELEGSMLTSQALLSSNSVLALSKLDASMAITVYCSTPE